VIRLSVRSHQAGETAVREYNTHNDAVAAVESAGIDRLDAIRAVHGEVFAHIAVHPSTGQRFAVRRTDKEK